MNTDTDDDNIPADPGDWEDIIQEEAEEESDDSDVDDYGTRPFVKKDKATYEALLSNMPKKRQRTKKTTDEGQKGCEGPIQKCG